MKKSTSYALEILKQAKLNSDVKLYPHQQRIVDSDEDSKVIAHSVGSGKTLTSVAKFETMREKGRAKKALVVVPASLRENFGDKTVKRFTDSKYNIIGTRQEIKKGTHKDVDPDADYNIISYDIFKKDPERYIRESGADTVISDEGHRGKNEDTALTQALKNSRKLYKNHLTLTGSVISNSVADIQPLVDVVANGAHQLGINKKDFLERYVVRDNSSKYKDLREDRRPITGFKNVPELREQLYKYVDYADYEDVKDLANMPNKKLEEKLVELSPSQVRRYKQLLKDDKKLYEIITNKRLETMKDSETASAFSKMIEARKLMNSLYGVTKGMTLEESAKKTPKAKALLDKVEEHLKENPKHRALLFSNLIHGGTDVLEAGLKDKGIEYGRFIGKGNKGVTEATRQTDVNKYNKGKNRVMLVSSAGGEGLSLDDTTYEGVLDGHYNPERMNQMEARGIRSGGLSYLPKEERNVQVDRYKAVMPKKWGLFKSKIKTPDEVVYEIANRKSKQNKVLQDFMKDNQTRKGDATTFEEIRHKLRKWSGKL